ncbi:hypothetical protein JTE90_001380 [Oedothorax gibbosus]|uniref:ATP-dependent RNA helicase n=1 Tax=Oedothorax gibbosus TaxID=931172 RepID=A0AAV6VHD5_9ARAC|nr:hypothetical protein JTE90_001380 [Oedothorax gibbosus]
MADGLFLMQRYMGSDDDSDESNEIIQEDEESLKKKESVEVEPAKPKKKKHKKSFSEHQEETNEKCVPLNEDIVEVVEEKTVKSPKKKKLKIESSHSSKFHEEVDNKKPSIEEKQDNIEVDQKKPVKLSKKKKSKVKNDKDTHPSKQKKNDADSAGSKDPVTTKEKNFIPLGLVKVQNKLAKPSLPNWMCNPTVFEASLQSKEIPISDLDYLDENTKAKLKASKIDSLFPVQAAVIPWLKESMHSNLRCLYRPSDLCVSAPTGSGKTLSFVLPIIDALKDRVVCSIKALVVLPVHELALQVFKVFKSYTQGTNLKVCLLSGKKSFPAEQKYLVATGVDGTYSCVDIVVTTPGRVLDHINKTEGFSLEHLQYLVIDEADRMMQDIQQGWLKRIEEAVFKTSNSLPSCTCSALVGNRMPYIPVTVCQTMYLNEPLQKLLFSATLFHDPERLHALSLYKPKLFAAQAMSDDTVKKSETVGKCTIPDNLDLLAVTCNVGAKPMALCHFIKDRQFKKVLCFTESVERARRLSLILANMALLRVREISSNNTAVQRNITLKQFASGKVDVIICSDLVARGMDIEGVDCVISYDVPPFVEAFVHRIGRTARAGKSGTAVALMTSEEVSSFQSLLKTAEIQYPQEVFVEDASLEQYVESFKSALTAADATIRKMKSGKTRAKAWKKPRKGNISGVNRVPVKNPQMKSN